MHSMKLIVTQSSVNNYNVIFVSLCLCKVILIKQVFSSEMIELCHVILYVNILEEIGSLAYFLPIAMVILINLTLCAFR